MPSIIDQHIIKLDTFLRRNRRAYLRTVAAELGMPNSDLRDIALREIAALAEFAADPGRAMEPTHRGCAAGEKTDCLCRK